eukprot:1735419-Lingulodinium_polyedra.AAC.1
MCIRDSLKSVARVEEPLQRRGNMIMELYKGRGDRAECAARRDVALCDITGKVFRKKYRQAMVLGYERAALGT